jgi:hypothetical protein
MQSQDLQSSGMTVLRFEWVEIFLGRVELKRIEGWFGTTSAQCGQNVALRIVGGSKEIETKISIYRMGYYGGARARLISVEKTTGNLWKFKVTQSTPPGQYSV